MGFTEAIRTCFRKYVTFSGRASRSEFWWFALFCFLGSFVAGIVDAVLFETLRVETHNGPARYGFHAYDNGPLASLFTLITFLPSLAVGWRRMHDSGRSGLHLLYPLIVIIGITMYIGLVGGFPQMGEGAPAAGLAGVILILAVLVLILSPFLVLWWLTRPSAPGSNQYGPNPFEVIS